MAAHINPDKGGYYIRDEHGNLTPDPAYADYHDQADTQPEPAADQTVDTAEPDVTE